MSEITLSAELIESWSKTIEHPQRTEAMLADVARQLRAFLPTPGPLCPNCQHEDREHGDRGCGHSPDEPENWCDCPFGAHALNAARALVAATVEDFTAARATTRKPRVFTDAVMEPDDVTKVIDSDPDPEAVYRTWVRGKDGHWRLLGAEGNGDPYTSWPSLIRAYGPLTEVLDGGES